MSSIGKSQTGIGNVSFGSHKNWSWMDTGPGSAAYNMALDRALLEVTSSEAMIPVLRFYTWNSACTTYGYFQRQSEITKVSLSRDLVRRPTGGGLVEHCGDWTFSMVIPFNHEWYQLRARESYHRIHQWVHRTFAALGVGLVSHPEPKLGHEISCFVSCEKDDLKDDFGKVAGCAQRRTSQALLIQYCIKPRPQWPERIAWQNDFLAKGEELFGIRWVSYCISPQLISNALKLETEGL